MLILLLLGSLIVFGGLEYKLQLEPLFQKMAERESSWAGLGVEHKVVERVGQLERRLFALRQLAEQGILNINNPSSFNNVLLGQLSGVDTINAVHLANEDGEELMLLQEAGKVINRQVLPSRWPNRQLWLHWSNPITLPEEQWKDAAYDVRARPWYDQAIKAEVGAVVWSSPYTFLTTQEPGLSISSRWMDRNGKTWVLGIDVKLIDLSDFTRSLRIADSGRVALVLADGRLLATPQHPNLVSREQIKAALLKKPDESGLQLIADAIRFKRDKNISGGTVFRLTSAEGESWFASVRSVNLGSHLASVVTLAPFSDYVPSTWTRVMLALLILAATLGLSALGASRLARYISRPLNQLAEESLRIGQLNLAAPLMVQSQDVQEIATLVQAHETMRQRLLAAHKQLREANLLLERRVQERTEELEQNQAQLADELALKRALVDSVPFPILQKDAHTRFQQVNRAYETVFGISAEQVLGKRLIECEELKGLDREVYQRSEEKLLTDGDSLREERHVRIDAEREWDMLYYATVFHRTDGSIGGLVGTYVDITEQKAAQRATEESRLVAESATRMKSEFLANMSHEIRTPMNAIIGMSHLALQTQLDKKQRNYIEKVYRSAENLLGIINDILDFSKIEAGKMTVEQTPFRLEDVMDNLANLVGLRSEEKGLELLFDAAPDVPTALVGDPLRLGQILINLGNNAVKFTDAGEVVVGVEKVSEGQESAELHFWVKDSGIGMTPEQCDRMFQSFSQADASTTRKYGGSGLGLAISKNLVNLMDGRIWVESEYGKGSTFHFHARFGLQAEPQQRRMFRADELSGLRLLVVDDNGSAREILSSMARSFGLEVDTAGDGQQALQLIIEAGEKDIPYDLVLMDWKMPVMDGVETVRQLHEEHPVRMPAIIMVTAYGREEALDMADKSGVALQSVLAKPVTPSALLETICEALGRGVVSETRVREKAGLEARAMASLRGARLLLVEDNDMNQELAVELLSQAGVSLVVAENGQEALDILSQDPAFDGVLMDCQMPVMDGYMATKAIRSNPAFAKLPVIAMTANAMVGDKEKAIDAGMNDHIAKPLNVQEMFRTLAQWIVPANPTTTPAQVVANNEHTETLPVLPGIDTAAGLATSMGNINLYRKLLARFCQGQTEFAEMFAAARQDTDSNAATRCAHTLKGTAGNIGAREVQAAAAELEKACVDMVPQETIDALLQKVMAALGIVLGGLKLIEKDRSGAETGESQSTHDTLSSLLAKLEKLLADSDSEAIDMLEEILPLVQDTQLEGQLSKVTRALEEFDFDKALEMLTGG